MNQSYRYQQISLPWKEQLELLKRYKETHDLKIKKILISANIKIGSSIILKKYNYPMLYQDLLHESAIAISNAIEKYDVDRGIRFSTYCYVAIRNKLYDYLKYNTCIMNQPSEKYTFVQIEEALDVPTYNGVDLNTIDEISYAIKQLSPEEYSVVNKEIFYNNKTKLSRNEKILLASSTQKVKTTILNSRQVLLNHNPS